MRAGTLRSWAEIDHSALLFNLRRIRSLIPRSCEVIGVVKADAYGHGLFSVARTLAGAGVRTLAVANLLEAATAARAAPRTDILLLSPLLPDEIGEVFRRPGLIATLSNLQEFRALEACAERARKPLRLHLKLDTGMGRLGSFAEEGLKILERVRRSRWLRITGLFSHLSSADTNHAESVRQLRKLLDFSQRARRKGWVVPPIHLQNSAGLLSLGSRQEFGGVRPGLSLYGIPHPLHSWRNCFGRQPLKPVLRWKTRIALIREVPAGSPISYGRTWRTSRRCRLAVITAGYADGISRKLSNRGEVLVRGRRCSIRGRVTMDLVVVDVSQVPSVRWGDIVTLIGRDGREEITALQVAEWAETNPYEVLCNISKRVPRIPISLGTERS